MEVIPKEYSKDTFIEFLRDNKFSDNIIEKFKLLPEKLNKSHKEYKIYIASAYHKNDKSYYNFELNYYSEELVEYLFSYKIFSDVEKSINYLLCELINNKYIVKSKIFR